MIPSKLKLYNFTAYGAATPDLNFGPLNLVVLSGPNGAGKSSILDAITWAVWGWSRAGDVSDQLVRLGQKEMWVELSFNLEGVEYQIIRARKTGNPGTTTLQFFANGGKTNLTEGTIKATQEKIISTLHLTYDTFVNSSYLRQGRADEFTIKSPTERKEILADILGLSTYDLLEERAKTKARESEEAISLLDIQINELGLELSSATEHKEVKSRTEEHLSEIKTRLTSAEKALAEASARREAQIKSYESSRVKAERTIKLQTEIANLELELNDLRDELRQCQELLAGKKGIEDNYAALLGLRKDLRALETKKSELAKVKDEAFRLERAINSEVTINERDLQEVKTQGESLKKELDSDEDQLADAKAKKDICPLCKSNLTAHKHKAVVLEIEKRIETRKTEINKLRQKYAELSKFKPKDEAGLNVKKKIIASLEIEVKPSLDLQRRADQLEIYGTKKRDLDVASAKAETITASGKKLKAQVERLKKELSDEASVDLSALQMELAKLDREREEKDLALKTLRQEEGTIRERLAEARQLVTRAAQVDSLIKGKQSERNEAGSKRQDYETLAEAFGKKGIQAMLIESAIPEIESESNLLLEKLTDGRMKVQLLTQRETKTAGIAETLDIIISDELGARRYEMYSGGEAFRINLAIRLALSRLLTRRAGAKLQFLIIDEGFGTQDEQGKYKIVEAINAISEDFAKILVVTHDPELKEAFPQRIEVTRGSNGSTFEVFA